LHAAAQWIAQNTGAKVGYLTEAANTVGGYIANALPNNGSNALQFIDQPRKAYLLLNAEPELDCFDPQTARAALDQAEMVVVMSPYKHGLEYADVLLPISPFTETAGTYVNCEGRPQSFNGTVKPLGDARPGWKVLRVLGNLLELQGFDYDASEAIRNEVLGAAKLSDVNLQSQLNNFVNLLPQMMQGGGAGQLERIADVPIYFSDAIARRSPPLQLTVDAAAPKAWISPVLAARIGINDGMQVRVNQGRGSAVFTAGIDVKLPETVVRLSTSHESTKSLGGMFGAVSVEKV
jgi:NADH-quinone oxidoreductase subunit G